jgi:hypothetical protein
MTTAREELTLLQVSMLKNGVMKGIAWGGVCIKWGVRDLNLFTTAQLLDGMMEQAGLLWQGMAVLVAQRLLSGIL